MYSYVVNLYNRHQALLNKVKINFITFSLKQIKIDTKSVSLHPSQYRATWQPCLAMSLAVCGPRDQTAFSLDQWSHLKHADAAAARVGYLVRLQRRLECKAGKAVRLRAN